MVGVTLGNAGEAGVGRGGWFVGHFVDDDPARRRGEVEIKWGVHRPGESNGTFLANRTATTASVLVRGRFVLRFGSAGAFEEVVLARPGDFALWEPGVPHDWRAEGGVGEETIVLTVRWPSVPGDQG